MSWQFFIILQTILVAFGTLTIRAVARRPELAKASMAMNAAWYVSLYASSLLFVPLLGGSIDSHVWQRYWWHFVLGGVAFTATNVLMYKTLVYFDAALATIAGTVNSLFTVIGADMVLGESLTLLQILGAVILLAAISYAILATRSPRVKKAKKTKKAALYGSSYALAAGLAFAVAIVNEKWLLQQMSPSSYAVFGWGAQMLVAVAVGLAFQPKAFKLLKNARVAGWMALTGVFRGVGGACFVLAEVRSNNVALVTVISNFKIILVVLFGWWLLKERQRLAQKLQAAFASIAGLTIMFWR